MPRVSRIAVVTLVLLGLAVVGLQAMHERHEAFALPPVADDHLLYVRSPEAMRRAMLSFSALAADVYWIRAVQHYGSTKLSTDPHKQFDLLYPLLDITTTLDPRFTIAYRFGAIFLAEPPPNGPGRADLAIALLQKGLAADPRWEYAEDIGFVYYWWTGDYDKAADWFRRAEAMPKAPDWLGAVAAVTLAQGNNRASSRQLWNEMLHTDAEWLQRTARFRLEQLDAMDQIDALQQAVSVYRQRTGALPRSWDDMRRVGVVRGVPRDPRGFPYQLDPEAGTVTLDKTSSLNPLPTERPRPPVR